MYRLGYFFRLHKLVLLFMFIWSLVGLFIFGNQIVKRIILSENLSNSTFVEIVELDLVLTDENNYYFELFSINIFSEETYIVSDRYMTMQDTNYQNNYLSFDINTNKSFLLLENEAAISRNLARKYSLIVGDSLKVVKNFVDYSYTIRHITSDFYGDFDIEFTKNGLVILGFNQLLFDNLEAPKTVSYSTELSIHTDRYVLKEAIQNQTISSLVLWILGFVSYFILIYLIVEGLWAEKVNYDIVVLKRHDYNQRQLIIYGIINTLYKYYLLFFPVAFLAFLGTIIINHKWLFIFWLSTISLLIIILIDIVKLYYLRKTEI